MLKKTVAFGSLLTVLCASSTLAHGPNFKSGFLAGAHVGYSFGSGKFNSTFDTNLVGIATATGNAKKNSALFGILAGYRHVFPNSFTLGFDISGNVFTNDEQNKQLNHIIAGISFPFKNKITRRYSIIPSVNFGRIFCDRWQVVLGLGFAISGFKHQVNAPFPTSTNPLNSQASTATRLGFVPSIGVEYAATQKISIIGNISYEIYKKISKKFGNQLTAPALPNSSYTSSINPRYLSLKFGVAYKF